MQEHRGVGQEGEGGEAERPTQHCCGFDVEFAVGEEAFGDVGAENGEEDDDWDELLEKFRKTFSEAEAEKFLRLYTKGVMASVYDFFEDGNPRADEDDLTWVLLETKADGSHRERVIDGFWEDDFVDEDFDWEK